MPMPIGCETLQYNACLASLVMKVEDYDEDVTYLCGKYHKPCNRCGDCGENEFNALYGKHTELYQLLTAVSGTGALCFDFNSLDRDYDKTVDSLLGDYIEHTMGYLGYKYQVLTTTLTKQNMFVKVKDTIERGYPALIQNKEYHTWSLITGYDDADSIIFGYDGTYEYWRKESQQADGYEDKIFYNTNWYEQLSRVVIVNPKSKPSITNSDVIKRLLKMLSNSSSCFQNTIDYITRDELYSKVPDENLRLLRDVLQHYIGFYVDQRFMLSEAFSKTFYVAPELQAFKPILNEIGEIYRNTHDVCWDAWNAIGAFKKGFYHKRLLDKNIRTKIADDIEKIADNDTKVMSYLQDMNQQQGGKQ